ncbi:FAD:protein FMN transferase [Sulfurimonas sp.]
MWLFEKGLKANVMSTELIIEANVSKSVLYKALHFAKSFEEKYSAYKETSLVNKINNNAGKEPITCTSDELDIFQQAYKIAQLSDGIFDPTVGSLTQGLYGFGKKNRKIPTQKEIQKVKKLVNYKELKITQSSISLEKAGMRLDLGGIGKGYVADKIIEILLDNGASKGFVSVGGEIASFGRKYKFAIKNPFENEKITAVIISSKKPISIATSGDYERFIKSQKHHHILNATTVSQSHFYTSLTLIKNTIDATMLDAITTIFFNTPPKQLAPLAKKFQTTVIAITHEKEILFENYTGLDIASIEFFPFK